VSLGFESHGSILVCATLFIIVFSYRQVVDSILKVGFNAIPAGIGVGNFLRSNVSKFFLGLYIRDLLKDLVGLHMEPCPQKFGFSLYLFCPAGIKW